MIWILIINIHPLFPYPLLPSFIQRPSATLARQCLLDMLYRRGEGARILHWHLLRGEVVGALRLVSHRSGLFNLPGKFQST